MTWILELKWRGKLLGMLTCFVVTMEADKWQARDRELRETMVISLQDSSNQTKDEKENKYK